MAFIIYGNIVSEETGKGIPDLTVTAFDKDLLFDDLLGAVKTNKYGYFKITYEKDDFKELFFDQKPDIYINVFDDNGSLIHTTENKVRYRGNKTEEFFIKIPSKMIQPKSDIHIPKRRQDIN